MVKIMMCSWWDEMSIYVGAIPILIVCTQRRLKNGHGLLLFKVGNKKMENKQGKLCFCSCYLYIIVYVCIVVNDINAENIIVYHRDDEIFIL